MVDVLRNTFCHEQNFFVQSFCGDLPLVMSKITLNVVGEHNVVHISEDEKLKV